MFAITHTSTLTDLHVRTSIRPHIDRGSLCAKSDTADQMLEIRKCVGYIIGVP